MPTTTGQARRSSGLPLASRLCKWIRILGTANRTRWDPASSLLPLVGNIGIRAVATTRQAPGTACPKLLASCRRNSHLAGPRRCLCGRPTPAISLLSSICCHIRNWPMAAARSLAPVYLVSQCKSSSSAFRFSALTSKTCHTPNMLRLEAVKLDIWCTAASFSFFLSSYPDVLPQTWAQRRQDSVACCVHQAVGSLPGVDPSSSRT
jgi:hypothetical protein